MVREAKGLLMAAEGIANATVATTLGVSRSTVLDWRRQFATDGVNGVGKVRKGRGRKRTIPQEKIDQILHDTKYGTPPGALHWSVRSMAKHSGVSKSTVQKVWSSSGLKPNRAAGARRSGQIGAGQIGAGQIGAGQIGAGQIGAGEAGGAAGEALAGSGCRPGPSVP